MSKQGRNDPCSCGSGKKYKQCCAVSDGTKNLNREAVMYALKTAWVNFEANRLEHAEEICQKVLKEIANQIDAVYLLGLIALKDGQIQRAVDCLNIVVKRDPYKSQFVASLGLAYHEAGQIELAVAAYRKAIELEPMLTDAYYNLHAALIKPTSLAESLLCLQKVVQLAPNDQDAIFMLGLLNDYQSNTKLAQNYFNQIINGSKLIQSRLDAWEYFKKNSKPLPILTGSMIDTFKTAVDAANQDGLVLEFGVRHGNTIRQLAALFKNQAVHGFDSFEGLPEVWHHEAKGSYTTKGVMPTVPKNVTLHKGWFDATLPSFLAENPGSVRLLNIDCDIYSSTKTVLDLLSNRIVRGSVIVFDEYIGNEHWREDEFKAFQEAVSDYGWKYEYLSFSMFTKQVVVRITEI